MEAFLEAIAALPRGYGEGRYLGRRWGVTLNASEDGRRQWLWAEELGGRDRVSCNLYRLAPGRAVLKPCEMAEQKVIEFVLGYRPDAASRPPTP